MATEAQRLIGISLAKIAQSRIRGGVSLHKNLLVATVLQKARYIFMEEAYHMVHGHYIQTNRLMEEKLRQQQFQMQQQQEEDERNNSEQPQQQQQQQPQHHDNSDNYDNDNTENFGLHNGNSDCDDNDKTNCDNKENNPPSVSNLIYFDMDTTKFEQKSSEDNSVNNNSNSNNNNNDATTSASSGTKRRREIAEWETEEAVLSILPKRIKSSDNDDSSAYSFSDESDEGDSIYNDESVFYDDAIATLSECIPTTTTTATTTITTSKCVPNINSSSGNNTNNNSNNNNNHQGIDRITSLVSIFSFGNLTRTLSTPDMCSAQAQDSEKLSQRTYLAMTV